MNSRSSQHVGMLTRRFCGRRVIVQASRIDPFKRNSIQLSLAEKEHPPEESPQSNPSSPIRLQRGYQILRTLKRLRGFT